MTTGDERLGSDVAGRLTPEDLRSVLLGDNADVRKQFLNEFAPLVDGFLNSAYRTYMRLQGYEQAVVVDDRAAWTQAFLFSAFNSSVTSCHLLISGFPIPAGNLMRHYGESCAMALLCSHRGINVFERLDADPTTFPVDSAIQIVRQRRNAQLLSVNTDAWSVFQSITHWYNTYSHATVFSLATQAKLSHQGQAFLGGGFDEFKRDSYHRELIIRVSSMDRLHDIINAVERNVKAVQSDDDRR